MSFSHMLPPSGGSHNDDFDIFSVDAAAELAPLPAGRYVAVAERGGPKVARSGTRGYEVQFRVVEGESAGRKVWKFFAFTPKAAAISRRDLEKLGIATRDQLARDLPPERFVVELVVAIRTDPGSGTPANDVKGFKVVRVQDPPADPFAPPPSAPNGPGGEREGGLFGGHDPSDGLGGLRQ
jgi:hypothetical protein